MSFTKQTRMLTHEAVMAALSAAVEKSEQIGQPQCIVIVDASGEVLGTLRMTGAKYLSLESARTKARTAASIGAATSMIPEEVQLKIGIATRDQITGLPGGLPIKISGDLVGGIGVGSGTGDQDVAVAQAALSAIGAEVS